MTSDATKTQRLSNPNWRPCATSAKAVVLAFGALKDGNRQPVALSGAKRTQASVAVTQELPVLGRAGTKERVRSGDAVFGGGETR